MKKSIFAIIAIAIAGLFLYGTQTASGNGTSGNDSINKEKTKKGKKEMNTIQLTEAEFYTRISDVKNHPDQWNYLGDKPAIIDFYATWCGPCKALSPVLEDLAEEYKDSIYIYKVDIDKERNLSAMFGIRSVPTLIFIPMTENPQIAQGALPKKELKNIIEEVLLKK